MAQGPWSALQAFFEIPPLQNQWPARENRAKNTKNRRELVKSGWRTGTIRFFGPHEHEACLSHRFKTDKVLIATAKATGRRHACRRSELGRFVRLLHWGWRRGGHAGGFPSSYGDAADRLFTTKA
jgi:hypothetical protein